MSRLPHGSFLLRLLAIACLAGLLPAGAAAAGAQVMTSLPANDKVVSLTFDAGADRGYTTQILDTLAAEGIHASFGMTGQWAAGNTDLLQRIVAEGHDLINHSWSHPSFTGSSTQTGPLSDAERRDQIQRTEQFILAQTGFEVQPLFRPPYGDEDGALLNLLPQLGYTVDVRWTIDTLGWNGLSAAAIRDRVRNNVAPGSIILMHVGEGSQDAAALPNVIADLRAAGYRFTTVRDALGAGGGLPTTRYFAETGHSVSDSFLRYWQAFGGLPVFGYPITGEIEQDGVVTQYFERARLELHPGSWPERFDIQLGLLGRELTTGRETEAPFLPVQAQSDGQCRYFVATGHRLCNGFLARWQAEGGLAIFGYPISEEFTEGGYTVQYFERQRFEYHPENSAPYDIEGGLLGSQRARQLGLS